MIQTYAAFMKSELQEQTMSLGEGLAWLRRERVATLPQENLSLADLAYLDSLRKRCAFLEEHSNFRTLLHNYLCKGTSYMNDETAEVDFYICVFVLDKSDDDCLLLADKLNSSFTGFQSFNAILRNFALTYEKLEKQQG